MSITLLKQKTCDVVKCSMLLFSTLIKEDQSQSTVDSVFNYCVEFSS